jgi:hypothetical protein
MPMHLLIGSEHKFIIITCNHKLNLTQLNLTQLNLTQLNLTQLN